LNACKTSNQTSLDAEITFHEKGLFAEISDNNLNETQLFGCKPRCFKVSGSKIMRT